MIVLSVEQQNRLGAAARKAGSYTDLIRLHDERAAILANKQTPKLVRGAQGRLHYVGE